MIYKIKASNTKNNNVIEYELEGNAAEGFTYFDKEMGKAYHIQEVRDNIIREINNNIILHNSPIYALDSGDKCELEAMTFKIEIEAQ